MVQAINDATTRRQMISGAAAVLPALAMPAAATMPDPVFAAIETCRRAVEALRVLDDVAIDTDDEETNRLCDLWAEADRALLRTVPTTLAGLAAFVRYVHDHDEQGRENFFTLYMAGRNDESQGSGDHAFLDTVHACLQRLMVQS